ncbi:MAG TPA: hypothetical protein VD884_10690, partial [Ohtaekwangia sp.]|nr:hypothetical protein [Ohtaekwangia sp.]
TLKKLRLESKNKLFFSNPRTRAHPHHPSAYWYCRITLSLAWKGIARIRFSDNASMLGPAGPGGDKKHKRKII